jgi:hypothetical protein
VRISDASQAARSAATRVHSPFFVLLRCYSLVPRPLHTTPPLQEDQEAEGEGAQSSGAEVGEEEEQQQQQPREPPKPAVGQAQQQQAGVKKKSKGKNKKGGKGAAEDGGEAPTAKAGAGKKGGGGKQQQQQQEGRGEEDIDAILQALDIKPAAEADTAASSGGRKGGGGAAAASAAAAAAGSGAALLGVDVKRLRGDDELRRIFGAAVIEAVDREDAAESSGWAGGGWAAAAESGRWGGPGGKQRSEACFWAEELPSESLQRGPWVTFVCPRSLVKPCCMLVRRPALPPALQRAWRRAPLRMGAAQHAQAAADEARSASGATRRLVGGRLASGAERREQQYGRATHGGACVFRWSPPCQLPS